jgi:hypothetical protein
MPPDTSNEYGPPMHAVSISGTGVFTPEETISNAELVAAFNAYADRQNALHADEIAAGEREPVPQSNEGFIVKASGIESRYVLDKKGTLDPGDHASRPARALRRRTLGHGRDGAEGLRRRRSNRRVDGRRYRRRHLRRVEPRARLSGHRHRDPAGARHRGLRLRHERRLFLGHLRHPGRRRHDPLRLGQSHPDGQSRDLLGASGMARPRLPFHLRRCLHGGRARTRRSCDRARPLRDRLDALR